MATSAIAKQDIDRGQALTWVQVRDRLPKKMEGEWGIAFVRSLMKRLGGFKFARTLYLYERDLDAYIASLAPKAEGEDE